MNEKKKNTIKIKQPYAITMARYKLNMHEQRVFLRILEKLQPQMVYAKNSGTALFRLDNQVLRLKTNSLMPDGSRHHELVKKALQLLKRKEIVIKGNDGKTDYELFTSVILQFKYQEANQVVDVTMSGDLLRCLLDNSKGFTPYVLQVALNCSSPYSVRLYQYVSHWHDKGVGFELPVSLATLRDILCLENRYEYPSGFFQRILKPAMCDLKKKTDVWFSIKEPIKEGRKIVVWVFKIHHRNSAKDAKMGMLAPPPPKQRETNAVIEKMMTQFKLSYPQAKKIYTNVSEKDVNQTLYDINLRMINSNIGNVGLYTWRTFTQKFFVK